MDSNIDILTSENQAVTWGSTLANEQLRDAIEQVRSKSALLDRLTEQLTEIPTLRTSDRQISRNPEPFSGDDKNITHRQEIYGT